jgi:hypothetical protein
VARIAIAPALLCIAAACLAPVVRADEARDRIARVEAAVAAQSPVVVESTLTLSCKTGSAKMDQKICQTAQGAIRRSVQESRQTGEVPSTFGIYGMDCINPFRPVDWQINSRDQAGGAQAAGAPMLRILPSERVAGVDYEVVEVTEDPAPVAYREMGFQEVACKRRVRKLYIGKDDLIHRITGVVTYFDPLVKRGGKAGAVAETEQEATFELQVVSYHKAVAFDPRPNSQAPLQTVTLEKPLVGPLALSPDGKLCAIGTQDGDIHLLSAATGKEIRTLRGHQSQVAALAFTPDSRRLASVDGLVMAVWDVDAGKVIYTRICPNRAKSLAISPDGKTVVMPGMNAPLEALDLQTGKSLRKLNILTCVRCAFSPDGNYLAALTSEGLKMADTRTWKVETAWSQVFDGAVPPSPRLVYSPDGALLVVSGWNGPLRICDGHTGKIIREIKDEIGYVSQVWFSPDGRTLSAVDSDQRGDLPSNLAGITTWDAVTWQVKQSLSLNGASYVKAASFGASGNSVLIGAQLAVLDPFGRQLKFWSLPPAPDRP